MWKLRAAAGTWGSFPEEGNAQAAPTCSMSQVSYAKYPLEKAMERKGRKEVTEPWQ
jgi:hypothetical protein